MSARAGAPGTAAENQAARDQGAPGAARDQGAPGAARGGIGRAFATVGAWTMLSRLVGFARDIAIAAVLGASPAAEAFLVAFSLPNMFRRFFAEGAFNMAFIPIFAKKVEGERLRAEARAGGAAEPPGGTWDSVRDGARDGARDGTRDGAPGGAQAGPALAAAQAQDALSPSPAPAALASAMASSGAQAQAAVEDGERQGSLDFARDAFIGLASVLVVLSVLAIAFMPALVLAMAAGFAGDARFDLAVLYGRIAFPYILLISLAALLSGVLNALGRFVAAAAAPIALNVLFLAAIGLALARGWDVGLALSWSVPVAGVAQLAVVWWAAARAGYRLVPRRPRLTPELRRLAIIAAPALLAGGVVQVNLLVGRQVASFHEGAIAWLSYADRLYQLPLGVVGIAIGVVLLPDLSRRLRADDAAGGRDALSRAGEMGLALTLPAAVALVVIAGPITQVLFERGAFGPQDTRATALAIAVYGVGLPAFVMQKVLQPLYFARHDTRRPFRFALVALAVNAGVAVGLAPLIGFIAAAWGTTIAGWAMLWCLWRGAGRMGEVARFDARFASRLRRIIAASALMGAVLALAAWAMAPLLAGPWSTLALGGLIGLGGASYGLSGQAMGAFRLAELRAALRRR